MREDQERMKNLTWFAGLKMILENHENPVNDVERDETIEEIYQLTKRDFKK